MAQRKFFEDFAVGQTFKNGPHAVDAQQIKAFAAQFDPQPFHLDEAAAKESFFGQLVASGWHTAAMTMRLLVTSRFTSADGLIGASVEELKWPQAVTSGDTLSVEIEVLEVRPLRSRPTLGLTRIRVKTFNQHNEIVQTMLANVLIPRRPKPAAD